MRSNALILVLLSATGVPVLSQPATPFDRVMDRAQTEEWSRLPLGEIVQLAGESFLGAPYVGGLLDRSPSEELYTELGQFDCVLFVESALALARGIASREYDPESYARRIEEQRYRDGIRNGYCSRLHYFTEWIRDNEARATVRDITRDIGGERLPKRLRFMSTHRASYPRLEDDSLFAGIVDMERRLEDLVFWAVPRQRIREAYPALRAGDIVAFVTSVEGLDVSHTGLVYDPGDGSRGVLHASLDGGVMISPDLQAYVEGNRSQTGIVVARPIDHRPSPQ